MWTGRARLAQALVVLGIALGAPAVHGYVRSTSPKSGVPFTWLVSCLVVQPDSRGSQDLTIDQINTTLARAVSNWTSRTTDCSYLRLSMVPANGPLETVADGQPSLVFRDKVWARPGGMPHDPNAIGLTTVFHVSTPGLPGDATILDTDIELNGVNWTFVIEPTVAQARSGTFGLADLENTLTHELGHVQGLAHTCWDHITPTPPLNDRGQPIPDCNDPNLPDDIINTTMYPYSRMDGETSKRMLSDDDVRGICDVYTTTNNPPACFLSTTGGGCDVAAGHRPSWILALALVAAAIAVQRMRRA
jgi:hypothetical protein